MPVSRPGASSHGADGVFAARTVPPLPPARHVERPRLREAVDAAVPHGVVLVVAPAGFGKTVLLADFARTAGFPVAWLSVVAADADTVTFVEALVEAFRRVVPDFGRRALRLAQGGRGLTLLAAELADELGAYGSPIGLVLDDFHALDPGAGGGIETVRFVDALIERAPPNLVVAFGSRSLPALRHARLAAAERLHAVAADDLRFTPAEVAAYLDLPPEDERVAAVQERSGGWAAALLLGGASLPGDALAGYLEAEVLGQMAPEARRFMLRASVPPTLTADLCRTVLDEPEGPAYLAWAHRAGLFVSELPGGEWRLHDLFRDFLRRRLRASEPPAWERLHRAVAADMLARDGHAEAISLLIDAGLYRDAAEILVDRAAVIAAQGRWVAVRRWLAALPPRIVRTQHRLLSLRARAHMQTDASSEALDLLDRAVEACLAAGDVVGAAETLAYRAGRLNVSGRLDEALADCARVRALLGDRPHRALATAGRVEGLIAAQRGDPERALELLAAAVTTAQRQRDRAETAMCERSIGWVHSTHGNPGAAAAYYARAARIWEELDDLDAAAEVKVSLGAVYAAQGVVDLARRAFREARESAVRTGHGRVLAWALMSLGELDRDAGHFDVAMAQLEAALEHARRSDDFQLVVQCLDHLAQARLMAGDGPAAEALARQALAEAERLGNAQLAAKAAATLAGALLARGDLAAAERTASAALPVLDRSNDDEARVRALVVRAVCQ
ncbi:MAG TPA: tetratricopeptide repeat protein, partial [Chloroflexota bacterium]|nr:tetratricopeptide repeat protein [Chloroflexota bacterium]